MFTVLAVLQLLVPGHFLDDKPLENVNAWVRYGKFDSGAGAAAHVWCDASGWHLWFRGQAKANVRFQDKVYFDKEVPVFMGGQRENTDKIKQIPNGFGFDYKTTARGLTPSTFVHRKKRHGTRLRLKLAGTMIPSIS